MQAIPATEIVRLKQALDALWRQAFPPKVQQVIYLGALAQGFGTGRNGEPASQFAQL